MPATPRRRRRRDYYSSSVLQTFVSSTKCVCVCVCVGRSTDFRCALCISSSGRFAVAASGVGGAYPIDGTMGCGCNKRVFYHSLAPEPFQPTISNCAYVFTALWVVRQKEKVCVEG